MVDNQENPMRFLDNHRSFLNRTGSSHQFNTAMISNQQKPKPTNSLVIRIPVGCLTKQCCKGENRNPQFKNHDDDHDEKSTTCPLCGKSFPSEKSLFGHMRTHTERDRRGIQTPPPPPPPPPVQSTKKNTKNSGSSTVSYDQIDSTSTSESSDLSLSLPKWTVVRGKRGQRNIDSFVSDDRIPDAIDGLLLLKEGNSLDLALKKEKISKETESTTSRDSSSKKKRKHVTKSSSESGSRGNRSKKLKTDHHSKDGFDPKLVNHIHSGLDSSNGFQQDSMKKKEIEMVNNNSIVSNSMFFNPEALMKNKEVIKVVEEVSLIDSKTSSNDQFKCDTCNRIFSSHQALGGHKSSQKNCKNSSSSNQFDQQNCKDFPKLMIQADGLQQELSTETKSKDIVGIHKCKVCGATFPTGQALGGHQRRHYMAPNPIVIPDISVSAIMEKFVNKESCSSSLLVASSSADQEVISTTKPAETRPFLFDLNELPMNEDDDKYSCVE